MSSPDPVTVVVAPDSFKGSLSARAVAEAMAAGWQEGSTAPVRLLLVPMADGGEGTLEALLDTWGVTAQHVDALDPLRRPTRAGFGTSPDGSVGVVELAQASGLPLVADVAARPHDADTHGTGTVAAAVLDRGVQEILLCVGGSASTDGGAGMLSALGARFLDADGAPVAPGNAGLHRLDRIDTDGLHRRAREVRWRIAVDVSTPMTGPDGAAAVFGPQKGATAADVPVLDAGLARFGDVLARQTGRDVRAVPGTGAAGGVPAGLTALLGAEITPGADLVAEVVRLPQALRDAAVVLTGEGRLDDQSVRGKVVGGVARLAADLGPSRPLVVVVAGGVALTHAELRAAGVDAAFSIAPGPATLAALVEDSAELVRRTAAGVAALTTRG